MHTQNAIEVPRKRMIGGRILAEESCSETCTGGPQKSAPSHSRPESSLPSCRVWGEHLSLPCAFMCDVNVLPPPHPWLKTDSGLERDGLAASYSAPALSCSFFSHDHVDVASLKCLSSLQEWVEGRKEMANYRLADMSESSFFPPTTSKASR